MHTADSPPPELSAAKRAVLEARLRGRNVTDPFPRLPRDGHLPLSFAQERLWFLDRLRQGGSAYNLPAGVRLKGGVDEAALERALGEVVRRHESLRTTFRDADGVPAQVIAPFAGFSLPVDDLTGEADAEAAARRLADAEASRPFDLETGPLFRARLLRLGGREHALLLCMHHIVSDGWSMRVFFRELWALYDAYREGRDSPLAEPAAQYADFAAWQRDPARREGEARQLAYWRERLAGAPEVLALPTDHPRPAVPSFRGATVPVEIPAEAAERLRALATAEGATLYMVVLAAFQLLLARWADTDDVVVGTPSAGRTRKEVGGTIGFFLNTLVLRADLSGDPTFREVVRRAREGVLGAYEHQDVPFERVVAEVRPERSLSHSALFQVLFQLDTADEPAAGGEGGAAGGVRMEPGATKFDLTLVLSAHSRGISGIVEYATDLFDRATAERMAEHLLRVVDEASARPDARVSTLELMGPEERERVVVEWNRTGAEYPAGACIHHLFEAQAARTPDDAAVTFGGDSLTFAELDRRAGRLARRLRRLGVGPEARVGLLLERSLETMVSLLGVLKAGGAFVPVDASHPAERVRYILEDSGVGLLLTQERLLARIPAVDGVRLLAVDTGSAESDNDDGDGAPFEAGVTSDNLAYVIYTSGSTGRPKGVAMHHYGVVNYIDWGVRHYGAGRGNGAPVFTSMAVDLTITNLLPLFAGRPVHFLPEESPVEGLARALRERPGFGMIKITPVHLGLLTPLLTPEDARAAAHTLVVGADNLVAEPTLFWQEHAPGVRLMNEYGPTETVVGCSAYTLPPGAQRAGPVPVGGPIQNMTFYVADAGLRPVPVGLPGELYIGGVGVARGYLGRPALTAEKFVPDPFAGGGARMYRTGDRARWLPGGDILFLGRKDNQVKVRGFRVELGEVEAVLRRHEAVRDCLAVVREDRPGDRRLVAYVVASGADAAALRAHLLRSLPEYMVPGAFVFLPSLPQTATGKLDPRTLPAPEYGAASDEAAEADEPASPLEVQLLQLWEELLGVEGIGPTQSFFELGGNSLLALRLFAQANRMLECDLPVSTLFAGATVRRMAEAVREQRLSRGAPLSPVVPLRQGGSLPPLFCVHPADRGVIAYVNLVRHLGADQPVFGLRDVGDDLARPLARIAAEHVAAVRAVQPHGPYHLVGWSFGGFVAYEMASQLERAGERVAFLGLLDTMSPLLAEAWAGDGEVDMVLGVAADVAAQFGRAFSFPREEMEAIEPGDRARRAVEALHAQGAAPAEFDAAALDRHLQTMRDRIASRDGYVAGPFSGTITLFRATELPAGHAGFLDPYTDEERRTLGWCRFSPRPVEAHVVPGSHVTIGSEPNARVLAARMRDALALARTRTVSEGTPEIVTGLVVEAVGTTEIAPADKTVGAAAAAPGVETPEMVVPA